MKRPIGISDDDIGFVADQCSRQLLHLLRRLDAEINEQIAAFDKATPRQVGQYDRMDKVIVHKREHAQAPDPVCSFSVSRPKHRQRCAAQISTAHLILDPTTSVRTLPVGRQKIFAMSC
jgi:hypothetical protein